jgi:hypothetical protein
MLNADRVPTISLVEAPASVSPTSVPEARERARWIAPSCAIAVILVGRALQIQNGALHPDAMFWIGIAFVLVLAGTILPRPSRLARSDVWIVSLIALIGLVVQIGQLSTAMPGSYLRLREGSLTTFQWGLAALAVIGGSMTRGGSSRVIRLQLVALVCVHTALGVWIIQHSPNPAIDVHVFQRDAIAALLDGINPYVITFSNIYTDAAFYGPGLSVDGRLQFGFPYFPLSLLLAIPGQFLGDHRYSQLIAIELAAILMTLARPGGFGAIAAVLYLTTPRLFFVLEQSWTEPFVVFGLAAVVFAACRYSRAVPWLFGAFVALKQYLVFALPVALLLIAWPLDRARVVRFFGKAAVVGAIVTLPFLAWNPNGFWHSVVMLQLHQPFRVESLSFLAWWTSQGHAQPPTAIAFVAAALGCVIALWRLPRTPAGFSTAVALAFFSFFVFNKQAFCNYYFFVIGALSVSVAALSPPSESR